MPRPTRVRAFVSNTPEYHDAFATFLAHTDQKVNALAWLRRTVAALPAHDLFIDAGAGVGTLTRELGVSFRRVVAVEPSPSLVADLRLACPDADVLPTSILAAEPPGPADFVLSSHVFYYIPRAEWEVHADRLVGWLKPGGVLAVAIQNPGTDCMRLTEHFLGDRFDLGELRHHVEAIPGGRYTATVETVPAAVRTPDLATVCAVAEFVLNVLPMPSPPAWGELERYVDRFRQPDGSYRMTCDQDFLKVVRL